MNTLLIIDGHNLLFQMFFGLPSRIVDKNGKPIQGVVGFVGALRKLIALTNPTHVLALFDGETSCVRRETYDGYKANRKDYSTVEEGENPFCQLPLVYDALDYLKIKRYESVNCETDDLVASYVRAYGNTVKVFISSFDSDYFQLLSDNVQIVRYRGIVSKICDKHFLVENFGITPDLYASFKSLTGDSADNIKGVAGVGKKTAAKIVNAYGNIESIVKDCDKIVDVKLRDKIEKNIPLILTNHSLIKLDGKAELPYELDELALVEKNFNSKQVLLALNLK